MSYKYLLLPFLLIGCNGNKSHDSSYSTALLTEQLPKSESITGTADFTLDNKAYSFKNLRTERTSVLVETNRMIFHFEDKDVPVNIELSIHDMSLLESGQRVFTLPEDNSSKILIDLTIVDFTRVGKMSVKQLKFKEGTIEVKSISKNGINFSFNGEVGPAVNPGSFPAGGEINFSFSEN